MEAEGVKWVGGRVAESCLLQGGLLFQSGSWNLVGGLSSNPSPPVHSSASGEKVRGSGNDKQSSGTPGASLVLEEHRRKAFAQGSST